MGQVQFWEGQILLRDFGDGHRIALDPACCCIINGVFCDIETGVPFAESCPLSLLITVDGVPDLEDGSCCQDINDTYDVETESVCEANSGFSLGAGRGYGCMSNGMTVQWVINCDFYIAITPETPHQLRVTFTDDYPGPFNLVTLEYRFADGDPLINVPLSYINNGDFCITEHTVGGPLRAGVTITATAVWP